jgi:hypothetical protein
VVANGPVETESLERALIAELGRLGCPAPVVTAHPVTALPRSSAGKLKRFVPIADGG